MNIEAYIGILSAIIAIISALISAFFSRRSIQSAEKGRRQQYFSELRQWANETSDVLSSASHLCAVDIEHSELIIKKEEIITKLSSLIDRGRWFFPNILPDKFGQHKAASSKGIRQTVLSRLVVVYRELEKFPAEEKGLHRAIKEAVDKNRQLFVSDVHLKLDPRSMNQEFEKM